MGAELGGGVDLTRAVPGGEMISGGGALEARRWVAEACSQAAQWGLWMRPGNGVGSLERLRDGGVGVGGSRPGMIRAKGHAHRSMTYSHRSPKSKKLIEKPIRYHGTSPFPVVKEGVLYRIFRLRNDPHDRGTRPFVLLERRSEEGEV